MNMQSAKILGDQPPPPPQTGINSLTMVAQPLGELGLLEALPPSTQLILKP